MMLRAMISKAPDVRTYVADLPSERQPVIRKLRTLCREILKGYEECIEYGMPCYKRDGILEVSFASQKQYVALYILRKDVLDEFRTSLPAATIGKGCIRFRKIDSIDFETIRRILLRNVKSTSPSCP